MLNGDLRPQPCRDRPTLRLVEEARIVEVTDLMPVNRRELVASYLRAVERFRAQDSNASDLTTDVHARSLGLSALAEALNWADAIDGQLRAANKDDVGDHDWTRPLAPDEQAVIRAFGRVRNVVHHRWWNAVTIRLRTKQSDSQVNEWIWAALPASARRGTSRDQQGDAAFKSHLEGKRVLRTLDQLAAIFWRHRGWEIATADVEQPGYPVRSPINFDG